MRALEGAITNADCFTWNATGSMCGLINRSGGVTVYDVAKNFAISFEPPCSLKGIKAFYFSPLSTYLVAAERFEPKTPTSPNMSLWHVSGKTKIVEGRIRKIAGNSWPSMKWTDDEVSESAVADVERVIARLNDLEPQVAGGRNEPRPIRMSGDARKAYRDYCERNGTEQLNLSGDLASAWSKLEEAAARLALVVHCVRAVSGDAGECELDEVSMRMGIDLAEWFKAEARRIYAFFNETEDEGETRQLADWVGRRGGRCTPREAQQGCRWLKKRGSAREALDGLVKAGVGEWLPEGVGRARDVFAIRRSPAT